VDLPRPGSKVIIPFSNRSAKSRLAVRFEHLVIDSYLWVDIPPSNPLRPSEKTHATIFGLPKTVVKQIADEVINSVEQWQNWAQQYEVSDEDISNVSKVLQV